MIVEDQKLIRYSRKSCLIETVGKKYLKPFVRIGSELFCRFYSCFGDFIFIVLWIWNGLKNTFKQFFLDDATNTLWVYPGKTSKPYRGFKANRRIEFENSDLEDIKDNFKFFLEGLHLELTEVQG